MLPPGRQVCPRCGARLEKTGQEEEERVGRREIFWLSAYTITMVAIPILIGVAIGLICLLFYL